MAILTVSSSGPYFEISAATLAAAAGDTINVLTPKANGALYGIASVMDDNLTISAAVNVDIIQLGLAAGVVQITGTGPSSFFVYGNGANNLITTGDTDDLLMGSGGNDTLNGGGGDDIASYQYDPAAVNINLATGTGTDGYGGTDTLVSIEALLGSQFADTLIGDANDNYFLGLGGNDTIIGGGGIDTLSYEDIGVGGGGVTVNLATGVATDGLGGTDAISGIEYVIGSSFGDTLVGDDKNNQFIGDGGDDRIDGGDGLDIAVYSLNQSQYTVTYIPGSGSYTVVANTGIEGQDLLTSVELVVFADSVAPEHINSIANNAPNTNETFVGDAGDNTFDPGNGSDTVDGQQGFDTVTYASSTGRINANLATGVVDDGMGGADVLTSIEHIVGGAFNDSITGSAADERFTPGVGSDSIDGGGGHDVAAYTSDRGGVSASLVSGQVVESDGSTDTLVSIEGLIGSQFDDVLTGDTGANTFVGLGGDDTIAGGDGVDTVSYQGITPGVGGVTVNLLTGIASDGFGGTDTLSSIENIVGSEGGDVLTGDSGDNFFAGGSGADTVDGGDGFDTLSFADNPFPVRVNLFLGQGGGRPSSGHVEWSNDSFVNVEGFVGSEYDDHFDDVAGANSYDGGAGKDTISYRYHNSLVVVDLELGTVLEGNGETDQLVSVENFVGSNSHDFVFDAVGENVIDGHGGTDTVSFERHTGGVTVNLTAGVATDSLGNTDALSRVESVHGSAFDDHLTGGTSSQGNMKGLAGDDTFVSLTGRLGWVSYALDPSGVSVDLLNGTATDGFGDSDTLIGALRIEGSDHDDTLSGDHSTDYLYGLDGDDTINGLGGADFIRGGAGNDILDGGEGEDELDYSWGVAAGVTVNLLTGSATDSHGDTDTVRNFERVVGSNLDDVIIGGDAGETLVGAFGSDTIRGGGGNDVIRANLRFSSESDANFLFGDGGDDELIGSDGNDVLDGGDGDDVLNSGLGINTLTGGAGHDTFRFAPLNYSRTSPPIQDEVTDLENGELLDIGVNRGITIEHVGSTTRLLMDRNSSGVEDDWITISNGRFTFEETRPYSNILIAKRMGTTSDVDGDGDDDVVYSLTASGNFVTNSADGTGGGWIGYADRTVIGTGDFNGDGDADLLFRFADGNHSGFDSGGGGPWLGRSDRTAAAVGDFNGDGDDDVLFEFANGNKHIADADSGNTWVGFADRSIEGVGDFDGDGDDDVLFELDAGGYVTNNVDGTGGRWLGGPDRDVAGIGDFDGDGDDDILFVLNSGGHIINDGEGGGMQWFGFTDRTSVGIGDFDGDGNDDILFRLSDGNHTIISPNGVGRWIARTNNTVRDVGDYDGDGDDDILFEAPGGGFVVDQADGGVGLGMYFLDRTLVAGDPLGIGLTSDADLV